MKKSQDNLLHVSNQKSNTTKMSVSYVSADSIGINYETLPGNQPSNYGNYVAIWQNSNSIPWNQQPLKIQKMAGNTPSGSMVIQDLDTTKSTYIIGYAVGPELTVGQKYGNICSTSYIANPGSGDPSIDFYSSLQLIFVGDKSLAVNFNLPVSITPKANLAWAGIWRSSNASYTVRPDATTPVTIDTQSGTLTFDQFTIAIGETYTIALFMSGWKGFGQKNEQTAMACTLTFTNDL